MSIIQSIRSFIAQCPLLEDGKLNIDYLGVEPLEYSIDSIPCETIIKKYVDGSEIRQYEFVFASRQAFGSDVWQNLANSDFYEKFADCIDSQNYNENFPDLESQYRTPQSVEVTSSGYVFELDTDNARYQIQLRLTYYQDRRYKNG